MDNRREDNGDRKIDLDKKGCAKSQTGIGLVRLSFAKKREGDEAR